jgi:hypothetical protein
MRLHDDWPEVNGDDAYFILPTPYDDISVALETARAPVALADLATVTHYGINYHGHTWTPGEAGGSELEMVLLGTLRDGRHFALEAWNDYTGWGCQDGADFYAGDTEGDVIHNGLTQEGRTRLGVSLPGQ